MSLKRLSRESLIFLMNNNSDCLYEQHEEGMQIFSGMPVSRGFASAPAYVFRPLNSEAVSEVKIAPEDVDKELQRLQEAITKTKSQLRLMANRLRNLHGSVATIMDGHEMLVEDTSVIGYLEKRIKDHLYNAEWAVSCTANHFAGIFNQMSDEYLKERANDVHDIARRILRNLRGQGDQILTFTEPRIVVATDLTPSETILLPKDMVLGLATDRGSVTSHASLLARAMGIPAVVGIGRFSEHVRTGDRILLDGSRGKVVLNPGASTQQAFAKIVARAHQIVDTVDQFRQKPGLTRDGYPVKLMANVDHKTGKDELQAVNAQGVGLFRTEYLWLSLDREPSEDEQYRAYSKLVDALPKDQEFVIRALDLGGDKMVTGSHFKEANPFLGNRSIRYLLNEPNMFHRQLRAILRTSAHGNVSIMYPMIATLEEFRAANAALEHCKQALKNEDIPFNEKIKTGVMIEVPSAALIANELAQEADFFSIGTNDLVQYTLAVDRLNENVAHLYQPTHPAVLRLIDMTVRAGHDHHCPVAVCGEMASDPVMAVLLIGLGVDELSMAPNQIPQIKYVLSQVTIEDARALAKDVLSRGNALGETLYADCKAVIKKWVPDVFFV
jgi:phosphotransferase system enzyme I (PtsI)